MAIHWAKELRMTRLFPRAVPEALIALLLVGGGCSPKSDVTPGAPVLTTLTIVEPNGTPHGTRWDITGSTAACPTTYAEGQSCDAAVPLCQLAANVICHCDGTDPCDPHAGKLVCTYSPMSYVVATFDRILDTTPFEAKTTVATLTGMPVTAAVAATDYTSNGSTTGLIYTHFSDPTLTGGYFPDLVGPNIMVTAMPTFPVDNTVTVALDQTLVLAKDGKTPFTGANLLKDGTVVFKTGPFEASITVPAPPPPMDMGGGMTMMMCPDAGTMTSDGGDGGMEDGGNADGGASDAPPASDAGTPPESDAGAADAGTPPPSTDVPSGMAMDPITINFTNLVKEDVLTHITMTEDGVAIKINESFMTPMDQTFPSSTVKLVPTTAWAAGKTYAVTVDKDAADALGAKLGTDVSASFTMAKSN
jgi:hypothetical protein